ncbi:unnamed protein product [Prorocentrum cordatum]|uniref:Uncharacterized protein n=1 Tax=Prorocentrum cordatum TaxID=2364126 RepID=A0ABN9YAI7_9DINO|nr:unnamed protein product [Polarella glacialis]
MLVHQPNSWGQALVTPIAWPIACTFRQRGRPGISCRGYGTTLACRGRFHEAAAAEHAAVAVLVKRLHSRPREQVRLKVHRVQARRDLGKRGRLLELFRGAAPAQQGAVRTGAPRPRAGWRRVGRIAHQHLPRPRPHPDDPRDYSRPECSAAPVPVGAAQRTPEALLQGNAPAPPRLTSRRRGP